MFNNVYNGKRVFLTGHTGFKGSWLAEWLLTLGAEVHGYALDPQPHEVLFDELRLSGRLASDVRADLSDLSSLSQAVARVRPEIVFHLAAQPLVRLSYRIPVETFATNVMGTAHLLEAVRQAETPCSVVCVTTDKCYENREWLHAYREEDAMGGHDPYSASKGAAELVIASYRRSFFDQRTELRGPGAGIRVASARAGNVIGGGDWAEDRIVPDCIRSWLNGAAVTVRNRTATRPWQHVLEPLSGYLQLAASLSDRRTPADLQSAFNFGPALTSNRTVAELVEQLATHLNGRWIDGTDPQAVHEATKLNLATDKAFHLLEWQPVWNFEETLAKTAVWYVTTRNGIDPQETTTSQIREYCEAAGSKGIHWAVRST